MRKNIPRRNALLDAAIEVLAGEGARGLTFRAVDAEAGTPVGTASNYFANRDDLLMQTAERVYERWTPDEATWAAATRGPRDTAKVTELMREMIGRITGFRSGYLAMLELRLEATRRGQVTGSTGHAVTAVVPLAELFGYVTALRSRTHGRGTCTTRPAGYQPAA